MAAEKEKDSKLQSMCRKTRLCRFHAEGCCSRGDLCNFAHFAGELQAPPDLSCTKLCPTLVSTGACGSAACKFAHSKGELRSALARVVSAQQWHGGAAEAPLLEDARGGRPGGPRGAPAAAVARAGRAAAATPEPARPLAVALVPAAAAPPKPPAAEPAGPPHGGPAEQAKPERKGNPERKTRFHRTKLCQYHLHGRCSKRDKCDFAHGEAELLQARRAGASRGGAAGLEQRGGAADASGHRGSGAAVADGGGGRPRGRRPGDVAPLGKPADCDALVRTLSGETMCSLLTTSTLARFGSSGSASDSTACAEEPHEMPPEEGPADEDGLRAEPPAPPAECPMPLRGLLAAGRYRSEPAAPTAAERVVPLTRSQSADEDPTSSGGRAGDGFVTTVKNTFITVYMGTDGDPTARRRSQSQSNPGRGRAHEPL